MSPSILQPVAALMLLTFLVWLAMLTRRLRYLVAKRIHPQRVATLEQLNALLPERVNRPSNNLKNLFELPVLFYVACVALFALRQVDTADLILAWSFVALRAIHSAIQCSLNIVHLRFVAYVLSSTVLWLMIGRFALRVF